MKLKIIHPFWQVISLGVLAGMRASSAPEIASHVISRRHLKDKPEENIDLTDPKQMGLAIKGLAIAEVATDRPSKRVGKVRAFGLVSRCASGCLAGAGVYKASGGNVLAGAILGGVTALGASLGSYYLQNDAEGRKYVIEPVKTALEDALVIGAGATVINAA